MNAQVETFEFQSEARQVLDLMIHSVYSNREIFLRELISNSSDALDKLRFESLTQDELSGLISDLHIRIESDASQNTLSVIDNGIGMSRDEVINFIGTIAQSGTQEFLKVLQESREKEVPPELIGQFGVGFYSSFMVSDRVTLVTRKAGEETAVKWESVGDGSYTLQETEQEGPGTTITLHLKKEDSEEGEDFTSEWKIREIVKRYSDYVAYPIRMNVQRTEPQLDAEGKPIEGQTETVMEDETLNSMKAIWTRSESEVEDEEYNEFYKHISHDWNPPLNRMTLKAEGTQEFRALLYIPSKAPSNLFFMDGDRGLRLYIRRVFIMNDCKDLIPEYFRFIRGVVDSEDLPLNISREILQNNRQVRIIRNGVIKKILSTLKEMRDKEKEQFQTFWNEFGKVVKEGISHDPKNKDAILNLCLFQSTHSTDPATLGEYIGRMKVGQDSIYYATGESRQAVENSPHLEAFKEKGYEVLLLSDPIDELWVQSVFEYQEKKFQAVGKGDVELGTEEEIKKEKEAIEEKEKDLLVLMDSLRKHLQDQVKEVRLSSRLTSSPACLVGEGFDMSPHLEKLMKESGQAIPPVKRILELNPSHPVITGLQTVCEKDKEDPVLADHAKLLYGQAILAEGSSLDDPAGFSKLVADLMNKSL